MRRHRSGLSELLSALILLGVSIAVAFILVNALPIISPPSVKPWLKPTLIHAYRSGPMVTIYLYNPHSEPITVIEAWADGSPTPVNVQIPPRRYERISVPTSSTSILLRLDSGAWMEVSLG